MSSKPMISYRVLSECIVQLCQRRRKAAASTPLGYLTLAYFHWNVTNNKPILLWLCLVIVMDILIFTRCTLYLHNPPNRVALKIHWLRYQIGIHGVAGLCWGLAPLLLSPPKLFTYALVTQLFMFGVSNIALATLSTVRLAGIFFTLAICSPTILYFGMLGGPIYSMISITTLIYMFVLLRHHKEVSNNQINGIRIAQENQLLANQLSQANSSLQTYTHQLEQALKTIHEMAVQDELTGCFNRRHLMDELAKEILKTERYGHPVSLLMIDLDYFKSINDNFGHLVGDAVLRAVAERIQKTIRQFDLLARYGGEEFICLLPNTDQIHATHLANRIRSGLIATPIVTHPADIYTAASIGLSQHHPNESIESWLSRTDQALYSAKHNGRNQVCVAPSSDVSSR